MALRRVLLSWSSGKDSAWALYVLRQEPDVDVVGLLTTFNEAADRVAMHAVRRGLVEAQAAATGLPLWAVDLPSPCSNADYEAKMAAVIERARGEGITHVAFGDLFLEDIRNYRIHQLAGTGIEPLFPLWGAVSATTDLARRMLAAGVRAVLTCVDPRQLPDSFVGRQYDKALLTELPEGVDPCGERGEFHTFCYGGPMFAADIAVEIGERVTRDGFHFADLLPAVGAYHRVQLGVGRRLVAAHEESRAERGDLLHDLPALHVDHGYHTLLQVRRRQHPRALALPGDAGAQVRTAGQVSVVVARERKAYPHLHAGVAAASQRPHRCIEGTPAAAETVVGPPCSALTIARSTGSSTPHPCAGSSSRSGSR